MPETEPYAPNNIDLASVADVREYISSKNLNVTGPDDNVIQRLITGFSATVDSFCSRHIMAQEYTEIRNGRGEVALTLKNAPVVLGVSLTIDTTAVPASTTPLTGGYVFDDRMIYLRGGTYGKGWGYGNFCQGIQNITIVYWAGWETIGQQVNSVVFPLGVNPAPEPEDLHQAAIETVVLTLRQRPQLGQSSTGIGPEKLTYYTKWMTDASKATLGRYVNHAYPIT